MSNAAHNQNYRLPGNLSRLDRRRLYDWLRTSGFHFKPAEEQMINRFFNVRNGLTPSWAHVWEEAHTRNVKELLRRIDQHAEKSACLDDSLAVILHGGSIPTVRHPNVEVAMQEACRLVTRHKVPAMVVRVVSVVRP